MMNENFGANDLKDLEFSDSDFFLLTPKMRHSPTRPTRIQALKFKGVKNEYFGAKILIFIGKIIAILGPK